MEKIIKIIIISLLISASVYADEWRTQDTIYQGAFITVTTIDWMQTRSSDYTKYKEVNSILGKNPSKSKCDIYFTSCMIIHTIVACKLPYKIRNSFQVFYIGIETAVVWHNYSIGVKINM